MLSYRWCNAGCRASELSICPLMKGRIERGNRSGESKWKLIVMIAVYWVGFSVWLPIGKIQPALPRLTDQDHCYISLPFAIGAVLAVPDRPRNKAVPAFKHSQLLISPQFIVPQFSTSSNES